MEDAKNQVNSYKIGIRGEQTFPDAKFILDQNIEKYKEEIKKWGNSDCVMLLYQNKIIDEYTFNNINNTLLSYEHISPVGYQPRDTFTNENIWEAWIVNLIYWLKERIENPNGKLVYNPIKGKWERERIYARGTADDRNNLKICVNRGLAPLVLRDYIYDPVRNQWLREYDIRKRRETYKKILSGDSRKVKPPPKAKKFKEPILMKQKAEEKGFP